MLKHSIKALSVGAALVVATSAAWAQTGNTTTTPSTTIGVTPQEAREAAQKAVPNANTGTLVRTEPSAAERASEMSRDATSRAGEMAKDAKDAVTPDTRTNTGNNNNANPSQPRTSGNTTGTVNNTTTPSQAMGITGTVPGAAATSGDAANTRNNPGTRVDGAAGSSMDSNVNNTSDTRSNMRSNNRPARADRN